MLGVRGRRLLRSCMVLYSLYSRYHSEWKDRLGNHGDMCMGMCDGMSDQYLR